ncbi:MAG: hypothetical protein ACKVH8_21965 [Pirellulales bacterium]|jgi:hypothetical protein
MIKHALTVLSLAIGVVVVSGCGSDQAPMGSVTGTVNFEGKLIKDGTIILEIKGTRSANGKIKDGQIVEVTTFEPNDGAFVGDAKVAIYANESSTKKAPAALASNNPSSEGPQNNTNYMGMNAKSLIPRKYNNPGTSGLTCEIKSGDNALAFDLTK